MERFRVIVEFVIAIEHIERIGSSDEDNWFLIEKGVFVINFICVVVKGVKNEMDCGWRIC